MTDDNEIYEMLREQEKMLEEALDRAESGVATEDDWKIIRSACGLGV